MVSIMLCNVRSFLLDSANSKKSMKHLSELCGLTASVFNVRLTKILRAEANKHTLGMTQNVRVNFENSSKH